MSKLVAVLDYGSGNVHSVVKALEAAGAEVVLMVGQQSGRATMVARVPQACRLPLRFAVGFMMLKRGYCTAVGLHAQVMQP